MSSVAELEKLRVVDLKAELSKRSLSTAGVKKVLVERLAEALAAEQSSKVGGGDSGAGSVPAAEAKGGTDESTADAEEVRASPDGDPKHTKSSADPKRPAPAPLDEPQPKRSSRRGHSAPKQDAGDGVATKDKQRRAQELGSGGQQMEVIAGGQASTVEPLVAAQSDLAESEQLQQQVDKEGSFAELPSRSPASQPPAQAIGAPSPGGKPNAALHVKLGKAGPQSDAEVEGAHARAAGGRGQDAVQAGLPAAIPVQQADDSTEPETAADLLAGPGADMMLDYEGEDEEPDEPARDMINVAPVFEAAAESLRDGKKDPQQQPVGQTLQQWTQEQGAGSHDGVGSMQAAGATSESGKHRHERILFTKGGMHKSNSSLLAEPAPGAMAGSKVTGAAAPVKEGSSAALIEAHGKEAVPAGVADVAGKEAWSGEGGNLLKAATGHGAAGPPRKRKHSPIPAFIPRTNSGNAGIGPGSSSARRQLSGEVPAPVLSNNGGLTRSGSSRQAPDPLADREKAIEAAAAAGPPPDHATTAILIQNLARPFNEQQQLELLGQTGVVAGLWTAKIKTHSYVVYEDKQQAWATLKAVQGISWPPGNKRILAVKFVPEELAREAIETEVDPMIAKGPVGVAESGAGTSVKAAAGTFVAASSRDVAASEAGRLGADAGGGTQAVGGTAGQGVRPSILERLGEKVQPAEVVVERGSPGGRRGRHEEQGSLPGVGTADEVAGEAAGGKEQALNKRVLDKVEGPAAPKGSAMLTLDELFRSTKVAKPVLYWLPLSDAEVAAKKAKRVASEGGSGGFKEPVGSAVQVGLPLGHTNR